MERPENRQYRRIRQEWASPPKECLTGLSALKQEELNARISFLQKTAARHVARTSQEIAAIKQRWAEKKLCDKEKTLADLIPDVHGWHNTFSLAELREAHGKIQSTLDYWKAKGYDLATDSKLHTLMAEVEQNQIRGEPRSIQSRTQSAQNMANSAGRILRITRQRTK